MILKALFAVWLTLLVLTCADGFIQGFYGILEDPEAPPHER